MTKTLRICSNGHKFYKSSNCPVCPDCEKENRTRQSPFSFLGGPARRALENHGIENLNQLSQFSEKELLSFHGMGPSSIPRIKRALEIEGLLLKSS